MFNLLGPPPILYQRVFSGGQIGQYLKGTKNETKEFISNEMSEPLLVLCWGPKLLVSNKGRLNYKRQFGACACKVFFIVFKHIKLSESPCFQLLFESGWKLRFFDICVKRRSEIRP